jgi:hypothetical protein
VLDLKNFVQTVGSIDGPLKSYCGPLIFRHSPVAFQKLDMACWGTIGIADVENCWCRYSFGFNSNLNIKFLVQRHTTALTVSKEKFEMLTIL